MMLDTTWNLLSNYVVSIPTVIICNDGIPIGFSFSLVELLDKISLMMNDKKIIKKNEDRKRCPNQLESTHGHLNSLIPRRNELFSSLKGLMDEIVKKNDNFDKNLIDL